MREQRRHTRYEIRCNVAYSPATDSSAWTHSSTFNISMGGLCMGIKEFINGRGEVKVLISDPRETSPIEAKGRLVWQSGAPGFGANRAGIEFTEVPWTRLKSLLSCHQE